MFKTGSQPAVSLFVVDILCSSIKKTLSMKVVLQLSVVLFVTLSTFCLPNGKWFTGEQL